MDRQSRERIAVIRPQARRHYSGLPLL